MPGTESIDNMVAFLKEPSSYVHHPEKVEVRQTHASIIAIAPPYVFKVKKQVNLGFLDFTSLESRKANCLREISLNSRLCKELYIGVVPISLSNGQLHFGSHARVVDYALQMNQLADGFFLHQILKRNGVTPAVLEPVLALLKNFYSSQPPQLSISIYGDIPHIRMNTDENFVSLQQYVNDTVHPAALKAIQYFVDTFFENKKELFEKRIRENHIKDCHGDLHLDHIHIQDGKICIYDCIEFNDRFRYMDIAADIAFLAMDLDFNGYPDLSAYVTNRMAELLNDQDMHLLMDFYKCYRACIRAKVESIQSTEMEVPAEERVLSRQKSIQYISLAVRYAVFGSKPMVVLVCGRIGSGKSTWAKCIAELTGSNYVSSDIIRKEKAALPLYERTDPQKRQWLYSREKTNEVYQALLHAALTQLQSRQSIVVDATFSHPQHRAVFVQALEKLKVPYFFLEMNASDEVIKERLAQREKSAAVISDARLEDFELLSQSYQELKEISPEHLLQINAEAAIEETLSSVLYAIMQHNQ